MSLITATSLSKAFGAEDIFRGVTFSVPKGARLAIVGALAALAGSIFDSLLGATVQAIYFCPKDQKETERHPLHTCGAETVQIRGWSWLGNDWVNFGCGAMGAVLALVLLVL